ncbi:Protein CBG16129 [Caenorhabditis briggsae]|uniref:Protein CBG16129 n=1 Tax=Caenorhabditis briggsae TaxID=6238 RepID=A8XP19_CAEBR|nr:Protein CBG16129 [Caenorhabditis briggsae]CAP34259.1 Protein CBG16129 [Caenorhabditis briggsae]
MLLRAQKVILTIRMSSSRNNNNDYRRNDREWRNDGDWNRRSYENSRRYREDDNYRRDDANFRGGYEGNRGNGHYEGNNQRRGGSGGGGGYQGNPDNYRGDDRRGYEDRGGRRDYGDNFYNQMGRMSLDGRGGDRGGDGNLYAQQRSGPRHTVSRRSEAGMENPGEFAGSADYPNMPVAKKDLAHNSQVFAKRPPTSVYDNPRCGTKLELLTNHCLVHLPEKPVILYEYNIDLYKGRKKVEKREETGPLFREIMDAVHRNEFPPAHQYVFNDVNLLWSDIQLPFPEKLVRGRNGQQFYYKFTRAVELGREVHTQDSQLLSTLVDAIATARVRWPRRVGNQFTVFKRSIFLLQNRVDEGAFGDAPVFVKLCNGVDARIGVSMSVKLNLRVGITACFDVSHTMFTRPGYPLVRLFWELIHGDTIPDEDIVDGKWDAEMKNARVTEKNVALMSQFGPDSFYEFVNENNETLSIIDHYRGKYGYNIRYPHLPCLRKKPPSRDRNRMFLFPLEVCSLLIDPVRFTGYVSQQLKEQMIQYTTLTAEQHRYMRSHGIEMEKKMLSVKASLLPPPRVVYGNSDFLDSDHLGEWKAVTHEPVRTVLEEAIYKRNRDAKAPKLKKRLLGSILRVGSPMNDTVAFEIDDTCYHNLMRAIEEAGQPVCWANREMGQAVIHSSTEYLQGRDLPGVTMDWMTSLSQDLDSYKEAEDEVIVPIVLMIFQIRFTTLNCERPDFQNDYNLFKWMSDNEVGVFTQGILYKTFNSIGLSPAPCKYTSQLVEKILGKVGTTHRRLERDGEHKSWKKLVNPAEPTLLLGVDVSHPSTRDLKGEDPVKRLSVATVVGNIDFDCTEFRASSKIQDVGEERIVRFDEQIHERIGEFVQFNGVRPAHIAIYRDGFSESDFQRTLYEEKKSVENACRVIAPGYNPTLTYIVVTKRHHTRFFLRNEEEGLPEQGFNVRPGTLVEDTVTTKDYYDFFLTTQVGQVGLARPTHYYVLWDTWKVPATFWPTITHALTYLFCRTTNTVNLPSPLLYAHLAAKRAKETMDGALYANA